MTFLRMLLPSQININSILQTTYLSGPLMRMIAAIRSQAMPGLVVNDVLNHSIPWHNPPPFVPEPSEEYDEEYYDNEYEEREDTPTKQLCDVRKDD